MTSPGGKEVGRVSIKVVPDSSEFKEKARKNVEQAENGLELNVPIKLDKQSLRRELRLMQQQLKRLGAVKIPARLDIQMLRTQLRAWEASLKTNPITIPANVEGTYELVQKTKQATGGMNSQLRKSRGLMSDLGGIARQTFKFMREGFTGFTKISFKSISEFRTTTGSAFKQLASTARTSFGAISRYALGAAGQLVKYTGVVTALAVAFGAMQTVVGGLAAGLAGLPVLISALAGPIATVALGWDGVKRAWDSVLKGPFETMKTEVASVLEDVFIPFFKEVKTTMPVMKDGFKSVARSTGDFLSNFTDVLKNQLKMKTLEGIFKNISTFVAEIGDNIGRFVAASTKIAADAKLWKIFEQTLGGVLDVFSKFMNEVRKSGLLADSLSGLQSILKSVASLFAEWARAGMNFLTGAEPGITRFIKGLEKFLGGFNWKRMGRVFGELFGSIGDSLGNIDQATITALETAFFNLLKVIAKVYNLMIDLGKAFGVIPKDAKGLKISLDKLSKTFLTSGKSTDQLVQALWDFSPAYKDMKYQARSLAVNVLDNFRRMKVEGKGFLSNLAKLMKTYGVKSKENLLKEINKIAPGIINEKGQVTGSAKEVAIAAAKALASIKGRRIGKNQSEEYAGGINSGQWGVAGAADDTAGIVSRYLGSVNAYGSGQSVINSFVSGMRSVQWTAMQSVRNIVGAISGAFPQSPAKWGPFSGKGWTPYRGRALVLGFADGIRSAIPEARRASASMVRAVDGSMNPATLANTYSSDLTHHVESDGFTGIYEAVADALAGWGVEIDANGLAKLVNKSNRELARRRGER